MEIARIEVGRTTGACTRRERIPAGIAGASVQVSFTDPVWDSLIKTVVFRGKETKIAEFDGAVAEIPHEVIPEPRIALYFGIFGHDPDTDLQIPLIEVYLGTTEKSTDANADPGADPTLPIWAQLQQEIEQIRQQGPGPGGDIDLTGYATEEYVQNYAQPKGSYLTNVPDGYATEEWVEKKIKEHSGGNVDQEQITAAVNEALAEAKASGEFDGADGKDGYTPVKGVDYFDGNPGKDGIDGKNGVDGYSPVRGKDYWTDADKLEIKSYVDDAILGGAW